MIDEKVEMKQEGDGNMQVGINNGEIHIHQNQSDGVELLATKIDQMQNKLDVLINLIINSRDKDLISHASENLSQFDTFTLDSYNGENTTHILIPVDELFKKPISPSIKKLITNRRVGLNYKGIDLQRDSLSVSSILSQMREIDG